MIEGGDVNPSGLFYWAGSHHVTQRWTKGIPAVYDPAGNLVCLCPESFGAEYASHIADLWNRAGKALEDAANERRAKTA